MSSNTPGPQPIIRYLKLENFTCFKEFEWKTEDHGMINVIVGENDVGKTNLMRVMYLMSQARIEQCKWNDSLLLIGENKPGKNKYVGQLFDTLSILDNFNNFVRYSEFGYMNKINLFFGDVVGKEKCIFKKHGQPPFEDVNIVESIGENDSLESQSKLPNNFEIYRTYFLPAKEVISWWRLATDDVEDNRFNLDSTYYALAREMKYSNNCKDVISHRKIIEMLSIMNGEFEYSDEVHDFVLRRGKKTLKLGQLAEGYRKIGQLIVLLRKPIPTNTVLFIDEPEANLHPAAIRVFVKALFELSQKGVQIYMATHSYFVVKQLELLAREHSVKVPIVNLKQGDDGVEAEFGDLQNGMPDNEIVNESVRMYEADLDLSWKKTKKKSGNK